MHRRRIEHFGCGGRLLPRQLWRRRAWRRRYRRLREPTIPRRSRLRQDILQYLAHMSFLRGIQLLLVGIVARRYVRTCDICIRLYNLQRSVSPIIDFLCLWRNEMIYAGRARAAATGVMGGSVSMRVRAVSTRGLRSNVVCSCRLLRSYARVRELLEYRCRDWYRFVVPRLL